MQRLRVALTSTILLGAMFVIDVAPAFGQVIEEIIVTARKREESMQDVPVSIQAFTAEDIERFAATNLNELADMANQVGMYPGSSGNGANMVIRGYGSTSLDPGIEGSVGINIDGVQTDRGHVIRQAFFDLQSVEVLKGPQALFFGKNSPAGVVAAISALPTEEFESRVMLGYETEAEEKIAEFMVSGRLTDTLNGRFAFRGSDSEGWIENTATFQENSNGEIQPLEPFDFPGGANDLGSEQLYAGRLTLDWQPTDNFGATWRILYTDMENDGYQTNENNACAPTNIDESGRVVPISQGILDSEGDCKLDNKQSHGSLPRELAAAYSVDIGNGDPYGTYESIFSSLNLEYETDWGTITAVTGYYDYDYERWDNFDGTNWIQLMGIQLENQTQWSQEIRFLSALDGPLNFMVGGFYETFERDSDNAGKIAALGFDPTTGFSNTWEGFSTVESDTYSFFAQAMWQINDAWELTAGARYTNDDKDAEQGVVYAHEGLAFLFQPVGEVLNSDFDDDEWSPEVTLTWRPNDDITVWAAYKSGYKSGGFSTNTVLSATSTPESLTFEPETADGGEIGVKSMLMDGRLRVNATAYYYEFDDIQISVFNAALVAFSVDNAASATTTGFEVEATYLATDNLTLRGQFGYNEGEYDDFPNAPCYGGQVEATGCFAVPGGNPPFQQDLGGEDLTRAPEVQGSVGFDYERPITANLIFRGSAEAIYTDEYQTNTNNNPLSWQDSFWRYNARVGVQTADGRWDLSVIGRNLDDELYQGGQADKPGAPGGLDLFGGTVRGRQILIQATFAM